MIFIASLYFGVSKPAKNISIFKVLGGFWVPKPAKNIGISMVFAGAAGARPAGQSEKVKRWHRKVFLGKSFSPINQAGPAI